MLVRATRPPTRSRCSRSRATSAWIQCPGRTPFFDKINAAYATCGPQGSLQTVRALTGVQINYLITVNFRGFRQIVDRLDGAWVDVDRRYFNLNQNTAGTNFNSIDIEPGYQLMRGQEALEYVRHRHDGRRHVPSRAPAAVPARVQGEARPDQHRPQL